MKIKIITDSAADFGYDIPENVTVIPMSVRFGQQEYKDGVTISHRRFYEMLIESDDLPTTSLISPGDFSAAYETALKSRDAVIVITISSRLSGTYQSAVVGAEGFENVYVVDSMNASIGEQILVSHALQLIEKGYSPCEAVDELNKIKTKIHTIGVRDTLEYLKKGGRISRTTAFVGEMLSIKPVLTVKDGQISMLGKARGSKNGNNFLIREIRRTAGIDFGKPVALGYTGLSDSFLQKYIRDSSHLYNGHENCLKICGVGATIGTHLGPGAILVSFFSK